MLKINFFILFFLFSFISISFATSGFYIEPYLQNVTQTSITIQWWTDESEDTNREIHLCDRYFVSQSEKVLTS